MPQKAIAQRDRTLHLAKAAFRLEVPEAVELTHALVEERLGGIVGRGDGNRISGMPASGWRRRADPR
jgi:hypothetical protein